jgi:hypothetical protein
MGQIAVSGAALQYVKGMTFNNMSIMLPWFSNLIDEGASKCTPAWSATVRCEKRLWAADPYTRVLLDSDATKAPIKNSVPSRRGSADDIRLFCRAGSQTSAPLAMAHKSTLVSGRRSGRKLQYSRTTKFNNMSIMLPWFSNLIDEGASKCTPAWSATVSCEKRLWAADPYTRVLLDSDATKTPIQKFRS